MCFGDYSTCACQLMQKVRADDLGGRERSATLYPAKLSQPYSCRRLLRQGMGEPKSDFVRTQGSRGSHAKTPRKKQERTVGKYRCYVRGTQSVGCLRVETHVLPFICTCLDKEAPSVYRCAGGFSTPPVRPLETCASVPAQSVAVHKEG